jgi:hypothetical protein
MSNENREYYVSVLRNGPAQITFTKVNGEIRNMKATLNTNLIPTTQAPANPAEESERSLSVIRVFDLDAQGWRSFRVDSVTEFQPA